MLEAKIIKTGRGPEIAGTRITVYDVIDYYKAGRHRDMIAAILSLSSDQVEAAIQYIDEHRDEVMASYEKNMEPHSPGEPARTPGQARRRPRTVSGHGPTDPRGQTPGGGRVRGILADINVVAQAKALLSVWTSDAWRDFWDGLDLDVVNFPALELSYNAPDALIWRTCQRKASS